MQSSWACVIQCAMVFTGALSKHACHAVHLLSCRLAHGTLGVQVPSSRLHEMFAVGSPSQPSQDAHGRYFL